MWQSIHDACLQQPDVAPGIKQASLFHPTKFELDVRFFREACVDSSRVRRVTRLRLKVSIDVAV